MKHILGKLTLSLFIFLTFSSCKEQIKMSNQEAQALVVQSLALPQNFSTKVTGNEDAFTSSVYKLEEAGFYSKSGSWGYGYSLQATEKAKPFLIGNIEEAMNGAATLSFKTYDIDFGEIQV